MVDANAADRWAEEIDDYDLFLRERRRRHWRTLFSLALIACLVVLIALWDRVVISIRSGEAGVLYHFFSGTEMDTIYGEGLHIIWPVNEMHIYNVRLQTKERSYRLLTKEGLPVKLNVAVRYRPDLRMLPLLHVTVGQDYLEKVIFPETEAVLRRAVGQYGPEEVYTNKRGFLESIVVSSLTTVEDRYITIDDVLIRSVELPPMLRNAIERKLTLQEEKKAYATRLEIETEEAKRKVIEAGGIRDYQNIIKESLTPELLRWRGIEATRALATSPNAKTVVIGAGKDGLPLILGGDR